MVIRHCGCSVCYVLTCAYCSATAAVRNTNSFLRCYCNCHCCAGSAECKRAPARPEPYQYIMQNRVFCTLDELSMSLRNSIPNIVREIRSLSENGNLGDLYPCIEENKLFASKEAYALYLKEAGRLGSSDDVLHSQAAFAAQTDTISQVQKFLLSLKEEQEKIDVEEVKQQTIQLYQQAEQLLDWLQSHPESQDNVRRFASCYLPTTLKLLKAYNDVEDQNSSVSDEVESNIVGFYTRSTVPFKR